MQVAAPIASAAMIPASKEVPNDESPFVQELLRRTREKADERYKERLADYNRRNFSDYFSFQAGNMRDLSPETQESIKKWLKENVEDRDTRKTAQSEWTFWPTFWGFYKYLINLKRTYTLRKTQYHGL